MSRGGYAMNEMLLELGQNAKEAEKKVQEYYKKSYHAEFTKDGWDIKKADFCTDECCEIYYGG